VGTRRLRSEASVGTRERDGSAFMVLSRIATTVSHNLVPTGQQITGCIGSLWMSPWEIPVWQMRTPRPTPEQFEEVGECCKRASCMPPNSGQDVYAWPDKRNPSGTSRAGAPSSMALHSVTEPSIGIGVKEHRRNGHNISVAFSWPARTATAGTMATPKMNESGRSAGLLNCFLNDIARGPLSRALVAHMQHSHAAQFELKREIAGPARSRILTSPKKEMGR